jgi:hypothetical protein
MSRIRPASSRGHLVIQHIATNASPPPVPVQQPRATDIGADHCSDAGAATATAVATPVSVGVPIGSDAWLWSGTGREGDVYVGAAPENVNEYLKALRAGDGIGLFNLAVTKKAVRVAEATPVRVIDRIVEAGDRFDGNAG